MFHPWRVLRHLQHVVVEWVRPHPLVPAATDGERRIWMDPRLSQVERRCVLAHELVHIEMGHRGCQPAAVERLVRVEAACRLIRWDHLVDALRWSRSLAELADELWVTEMVVIDRLEHLSVDALTELSGLEVPFDP